MDRPPGDDGPSFGARREPPPAPPGPPGRLRGCLGLAAAFARAFPTTTAIALVTLAVFVLEAALGGTTSMYAHFRLGALRRDLVFERGELYRLVCAVFVHHGPVHLVLNGLAFLQLGAVVERIYGGQRLLVVFLATGLAASLASALLLDAQVAGGSRGASGAVMGLAGLLLGAAWFGQVDLRAFLRRSRVARSLGIGVGLTFALGIGLTYLLPLLGVGVLVDNYGHLGGFLAGLLAAALCRDPARAPGPLLRFLAAWLLLVALGAGAWMAVDGARSAQPFLEHDRALALFDEVQRGRAEGRQTETLAALRRAAQEMREPAALAPLADLLTQEQRWPEALVVLERLHELLPQDPAVARELAASLNNTAWDLLTRLDEPRDPARALALSHRCHALLDRLGAGAAPRERAVYLDTLAEALHQLGRSSEAIVHQRAAVELARTSGIDAPTLVEMRARLARIERAAAGVAPVRSG